MAAPKVFRWRSGQREAVAALVGYLVLTIGLTYPLVTQFSTAIPGDSFDGWQNYWNLWWVKTALLEQITHPYFTPLLYHPTGVSLLFHTLNPFNGLLSLPIQVARGLLPAYNAIVFFSFTLGGFGAYLLARQALGQRGRWLPAFAVGAIFTFAPFHVAHLLGHMQVISLEWIPFFALYLIRAVQRAIAPAETSTPVRSPGSRLGALAGLRHDTFMAALFVIFVALCDIYYVLYCLIFTGVVLVWGIWRVWRQASARTRIIADLGRLLAATALVWAIFAVILSPLLVPMVQEAQQSRFMVPDPSHSRILSADLLAFVTPQEFHPLWGAWAREQAKVFTSTVSEHQVFAGFTVLALVVLGLWQGIGAGLWSLVLATFFILSLGPVLHVAGRTQLLPGGGEIPLPYGWLVRVVPFMEVSRSVSRLDVMTMLALGILAGLGLQWLLGRGRLARAAGMVSVLLILFEFLPAPYPMSSPDTPEWYTILAADPRPDAVMNLPMNWDRPGYLLYQTVHHKPLTSAYISRDDPRTLVERAPVLQHFRHLGPDIIRLDLARQGKQVLSDLGVGWVVLDRYKMPGGTEREYTEAAASEIFGDQAPVYQDDRLTVYEVTPSPATAPYLILGDGWEPFDPQSGSRGFTGSASAVIRATTSGSATLRISVVPGSPAMDATKNGDDYVLPLTLQPGTNQVMLRTAQPGQHILVRELSLEP